MPKTKTKIVIDRKEHQIDASGLVLGRLATKIAILLMGKHKPGYYPHIDNGDIVIVSNADKIKVTGKKLTAKKYYRASGYPGGIKQENLKYKLSKNPNKVIELAVYNMLPKNKLRAQRMKRLRFN